MTEHVIGVVGNPNCGKTTLFNALTGARQRVGNWPGVTVDRKSGEYTYGGRKIEVVDLPGIYSLSATSLDEEVARDYVLSGEADLIVNILDASNLERNLYLTLQLLEMQVPLVMALNMMDTAKERRIDIDIPSLSERFGCPVVPLVASRGKGVNELRSEINRCAGEKSLSGLQVAYPAEVKEAVDELVFFVRDAALYKRINPRYGALKLLEGDERIASLMSREALRARDDHQKKIETVLGEEIDIILAGSRYGLINRCTQETVKKGNRVDKTFSDRIDSIVLNRGLGIFIFLAAMYLMFMVTINIGGAFIDFFDIFAGTVFVEGFGELLAAIGSPEWVGMILAGGVGGGIQTIATFIPPIGLMFLCLCLLEDSGYMARAAFVMDRFMRVIGLPGKSFVPMLVGFGCNVPAIMATRTLENQRDRILTIMMNPFMSCGARLPVYALFAAAFFPAGGQNLVFGLYLVGIGFAVITGLLLKGTLLKGDITPFVMELPPYRMPTVRGVLLRAWDRLKTFIFRAGKVIIPVVVILSLLNSMGTDGSLGNEDSDSSVLSAISRSITPVFTPMGVTRENWPATVGIFTGIFAKEAVVGTLDAMYAQIGNAGNEEEGPEAFDFWGGIRMSFVSIPENLSGVADTLLDPLGLSLGDIATAESAAQEQEVALGTFGAMVRLFDGKVGAFAYLLFILLYFPCVAAIAAVYRETNWRWTAFIGAWTTGLAYLASVLFYQTATIGRHPVSSLLWITVICGLFLALSTIMRQMGKREKRPLTGLPDILRA
ncbi:MAG: Fe(2+) transporter permease subunit FeoB [Deltaproteobacteria bacterium]|nr:Fe(2+) transporter permease subunit FeoB [Deltaproteobacteria bacterium]